jgi:hypothetical protein
MDLNSHKDHCPNCKKEIITPSGVLTWKQTGDEIPSEMVGLTVLLAQVCPDCQRWAISVGQVIRVGLEKELRAALATVYDSDQIVPWSDCRRPSQ